MKSFSKNLRKTKKEPRTDNNNKIKNKNNLQNQVRRLRAENLKLRVLSKNPFIEKSWYHNRIPGLKNQVNDYHDNALTDYVYGIFHPDVVYRENLNIKSPSILPIPTSNFAFKETLILKPNQSGNFLLVWNPNYIGSSHQIVELIHGVQQGDRSGYFSNLYYCNHDNLTGNNPVQDFKAQIFKPITQDFSKYRLTSACIKVRYTGKVLNQSGMMSACASYMEFPRTSLSVQNNQVLGPTYNVPNEFPQLSRLGDFDIIRQGQWSKTVNLVQDPDGITCVYLPTDTLSQAFVDNADTITAKDIKNFYPGELPGTVGSQWFSRTANISFDICGYGIHSEDVPVITVESYYNYEIIVNEDQMPYFRPTVSSLSHKDAAIMSTTINQISSSTGTITTTKSHDNPSVMTKIRGAIKQGISLASDFAALIKLGSLII